MIFEVEKSGERIDKYLSSVLEDYTRSQIQKLIKEGKVLVNDEAVKNNYILSDGEEINITSFDSLNHEIIPENIPIDVIYEDEFLMVINKPSGMVVHPSPGHFSGTLVNALMYHSKSLSDVSGDFRPGIVHRIDKDTSGLLLVAKNNNIHNILSDEIKNRNVKRRYKALVWGVISEDEGEIEAPISRDKNNSKKQIVSSENSKYAKTYFKVLERFSEATFIECSLDTGRTHQIRVHFDFIGHPIVNDPVYGGRKIINEFGQMLHAYNLTFKHPVTGEKMEFEIELPKEFVNIMETFK